MESVDKLREWWLNRFPVMDARLGREFREHIDAIEDEALSMTNAAWNRGYDAGFASADDWLAQHEDAMAEHGWVRKNKEHVVDHAAVEVTPRIDWMRMADELDVFTQLVRGFAEQVEEDE